MKRAFLVLGPESSGTRLMTRIFMGAGCYGDDGDVQRVDKGILFPSPQLVVWRRSVPHGGRWPDIGRMVAVLCAAGYGTQAVITSREWHAMARSQLAAGHVGSIEDAYANLERAYPFIFSRVVIPFVVVSYEGLVQRPVEMLRWLSGRLSFELSMVEEVYDGNAKWYGKGGMNGLQENNGWEGLR